MSDIVFVIYPDYSQPHSAARHARAARSGWGGDESDSTRLGLRMSETDAHMTFRLPAAKPTLGLVEDWQKD